MSTIIFDFDGTIADSFRAVVRVFHEISHRSQLVTPEEIVRLRRLRLKDVAKELRVPSWRIPFLLVQGRRAMARHLDEVLLFGGMAETIQSLHKEGHTLFIMSSNSTQNVRQFLKQHKLEHYFTKIYGGVGLVGKARALRRIMRQNRLEPANCMYIGDEPRDIEGAKEAGIVCIAVSWGFNTASLLKEHEPFALVNTPEELVTVLEAYRNAGAT